MKNERLVKNNVSKMEGSSPYPRNRRLNKMYAVPRNT